MLICLSSLTKLTHVASVTTLKARYAQTCRSRVQLQDSIASDVTYLKLKLLEAKNLVGVKDFGFSGNHVHT
jgi:hypothetical protein